MATVKIGGFNGRAIFHTRHLSIGALESVEQFTLSAKALSPDFAEKYANEIGYLLALTPEINFAFQGDENPMLVEFKEFWEQYQKAAGEQAVHLALAWRKETHHLIIDEWIKAINTAASPYHDPVTAPYEQLTQAEKTEADNPETPLVSPALRTKKAS